MNNMSPTFVDDRAERLADTVQPAALNDLSLAALDGGMAKTWLASACSFGNCPLFFPPSMLGYQGAILWLKFGGSC